MYFLLGNCSIVPSGIPPILASHWVYAVMGKIWDLPPQLPLKKPETDHWMIYQWICECHICSDKPKPGETLFPGYEHVGKKNKLIRKACHHFRHDSIAGDLGWIWWIWWISNLGFRWTRKSPAKVSCQQRVAKCTSLVGMISTCPRIHGIMYDINDTHNI